MRRIENRVQIMPRSLHYLHDVLVYQALSSSLSPTYTDTLHFGLVVNRICLRFPNKAKYLGLDLPWPTLSVEIHLTTYIKN